MNPLPPSLRRILAMLSALPHPSPSILLPGIVALVLWLILPILLPGWPEGLIFTATFAASYLTFIGRRIAREARRARIDLRRNEHRVPGLALCGLILLVLFSQHSVAFSQHFLSLHLAALAGLLLLDMKASGTPGAEEYWGRHTTTRNRRAFSAGWMLLALAALALNEVLIVMLTPQDWLLAWAISPVILHYMAVMTLQVAVLSDRPGDLDH